MSRQAAAGRLESCKLSPIACRAVFRPPPACPPACLPARPPACRAQIVQFVRCLVWEVVRLHHFDSALVPRVKRHLPVGVELVLGDSEWGAASGTGLGWGLGWGWGHV